MNISVDKSIATANFEAITPAIAKAYLQTMKRNRKINEGRVKLYAEDMKSGRWDSTTGESIKFDRNGNLIDGQHRLSAIAASGKAIEILVIRGCSEQSQAVIDSGQPRSAMHSLQLSGYEVSGREASIFRAMFFSIENSDTKKAISRSLVSQLFPKYEQSVRFAATMHGSNPQSATQIRSLIARAYYCGVDPERLEHFLTVFDTGMQECKTDGIVIALRNVWLANSRTRDRAKQSVIYSKSIFALNQFLNHSTSTTLRLSKEQSFKIKDFDGTGKE